MHLKFLPHGKGSAKAAVEYLVGERDAAGQEREGVEVVRGNPEMVAAVADSLDFEKKYRSAVIAWAPDDRPTDEQIEAVLDEFEKTAWAGLEPDRYAWTAVLHRERGGGIHAHILAAQCDLETGRSLNIAPPGWQRTFDPLRDALQPRARLEPPGRPGAGQGAAPWPRGLHRGLEAQGRARTRAGPAHADPRLPGAARRARRRERPRRRGLRPRGRGTGGDAPGKGLHHRPRSRQREAVAAERSAV